MWCLRMGQGRFGFLETRCLLYNFPSCYDGIPDKELRKKDFVWAHGLWVQSPHGRDVMAASKGGGSWHLSCRQETEKSECWHPWLPPFQLCTQSAASGLWACAPHLGVGLPPQLDSGTALTDTPTALSPELFYFF